MSKINANKASDQILNDDSGKIDSAHEKKKDIKIEDTNMQETYDELKYETESRIKEIINLKKLLIYLVMLCFVLLYMALFFIHPVIGKGNADGDQSGDSTYPGNNVLGENEDKTDKNNGGNTPGPNTSGGGNDNESGNIVDNKDIFRIYEGAKEWSELKELCIFENSYFKDESKIAPGVQGTYNFTVENYGKSNMKYGIIFSEENPHGVNMVYKLKINGQYVAGSDSNWVKSTQLSQSNLISKIGARDIWTIEWKWEDDSNDAQVGMTEGATYMLNVKTYAEII